MSDRISKASGDETLPVRTVRLAGVAENRLRKRNRLAIGASPKQIVASLEATTFGLSDKALLLVRARKFDLARKVEETRNVAVTTRFAELPAFDSRKSTNGNIRSTDGNAEIVEEVHDSGTLLMWQR